MTEAQLRDELCRVGRSLHARGYVHGTTGNLSARLADGFLISASDACLGELEPAALVKVDAAGVAITPIRISALITSGIRAAIRQELGNIVQGERRESLQDLPLLPRNIPNAWPYSPPLRILALRAAAMLEATTTTTVAATTTVTVTTTAAATTVAAPAVTTTSAAAPSATTTTAP